MDAIETKLRRLATGAQPRVLDLFAGCGGISLGFALAGFRIAAGVEIDEHAARTHGENFHAADPDHCRPRDITRTEPERLAATLGLGEPVDAVDVIVGGPPCQAFARVGRSKLREIAAHPEAHIHDARAGLAGEYLAFVASFRPLAVLMENVPDILNFGGRNIAEEVCDALEDLGYQTRYTLLNSAFYGVPQMRERMFLVGYLKELGCGPEFPRPTNWIQLPPGYEGTRAVALRQLREGGLFAEQSRYVEAPVATEDLPAAVSAEEAIGDLPPITAHIEGTLRRGARRFDELTPYDPGLPLSEYAEAMRGWPGYESTDGVWDHVIRYLPRDWKIFARMNSGDQYPEAYAHAEQLLAEELERQEGAGKPVRLDSEEYEVLRKDFVPPYDPGKFPNKWWKMYPDRPVRTLMAHLGKDSYSHVHYSREQRRTLSVREAARLQSFPDGFRFAGTMNPAFRQIGNAVPPLLAAALAAPIHKDLAAAAARRGRIEEPAIA